MKHAMYKRNYHHMSTNV